MDKQNVVHDRPSAATPHPLAEVRRVHGWSYQDLARVIAEHARALGVPMAARREKVWRWEHWGVVPEADSQRALARALGIPFRELETRPWPRWLPARGRMPEGLPWTAEGARAALAALLESNAAEPPVAPVPSAAGGPRRAPAGDADPADAVDTVDEALSEAAAEWAAAPPARPAGGAQESSVEPFAPRVHPDGPPSAGAATADADAGPPQTVRRPAAVAGALDHPGPGPEAGAGVPGTRPPGPRVPEQAGAPGTVDVAVLDWLESGVAGLRHLAGRFGGAAVLHRVDADLRVVADLLDLSREGRPARTRLLCVAAELAGLGGWAAADAGRHAVARDYALTGLRLAHAAGDRTQAVALWSGICLDAVATGRGLDALAAAEAAVRAAGGAPPAVMALAASRLGRAHAALGAEGAFRRAAAEAERRLATAGAEPSPSGPVWPDAGELAAQRGLALLDLGLAAEAYPLLERGLASCAPHRVRERALYSAAAARARALTGDDDAARPLAREAARLSRHCPSRWLAAALEPLAPLLTS